ncbi:MAG: response regulator [candidate division Zixibacteria bacterium]|nr:response regulator [candidate division Zixibacteria bacterium]
MLTSALVILFAISLAMAAMVTIKRLKFFSSEISDGNYSFTSGSIMVFVGTLWFAVRSLPDYFNWFVDSAYAIIDISHLLLLLAGLFLVTRGVLHLFRGYNEREEEIMFREQKLNLTQNLQNDARSPYQFLELLSLSIKEIVATFPRSAGAIFLTGRNRNQPILATSFGLSSKETAAFEYLPDNENLISQALVTGQPLVSTKFETEGQPLLADSRFRSILCLPLISIDERIGAIILMSETEKLFGPSDIKVLSPVTEWLAEKIKSARLSKELANLGKANAAQQTKMNDAARRLIEISSLGQTDALNNFCSSLKGFAGSISAHLVAIQSGRLDSLGGSEPLVNISEQFAAALAEALHKGKPLVINEESEDDRGRTYITTSTLVYPLGESRPGHALLLRRESEAYTLDNFQLKILNLFSRLAMIVLERQEQSLRSITQRRGFEKIIQLLRISSQQSFEEKPGFMMNHLSAILPDSTVAMTFAKASDNKLELVDSIGLENNASNNISFASGEGFVGRVFENMSGEVIVGTQKYSAVVNELSEDWQKLLSGLSGQSRLPELTIASPLIDADKVCGVVVYFFFEAGKSEAKEWERLITLGTGLYSLKLSVNSYLSKRVELQESLADSPQMEQFTNKLNNYLSAIMGNAEIIISGGNLEDKSLEQLQSIVDQTELASDYISGLTNRLSSPVESAAVSINDITRQKLKLSHVSENLYLIAGRAREIELKLNSLKSISLGNKEFASLLTSAIARFSSLTQDDDIITISTYSDNKNAYLDISRHKRNFPPVEAVSGFGNYQFPEEVKKSRPDDVYLERISKEDCQVAFDRFSSSPSYLSFKFPVRKEAAATDSIISESQVSRILAVDDQPVILELISAMCQSLGYEVTTATSGEQALMLAENTKFELILTDLSMPSMSGLELARRLRKTHPDVPIILVTGWEAGIPESELRQAGISEVLYKPFRIEQLTNLVKASMAEKTA